MGCVISGLDVFLNASFIKEADNRIGLLANPASVDKHFNHAKDIIHKKYPGQLKALFSPQHGFFAEKQDNMIESDHSIDPSLDIPIFSLYHHKRKPTKKMMDEIDTLVVDIQDVGTRVYTFIYTLSYCMEAAAEYGKKVIVLDRPNPIGGIEIEGNILNTDVASFVGRYPIPMRHGLTIGEIALLFNEHFTIDCELEIVPMQHWDREMHYHDTGLPWVLPSPNLPSMESAYVYPGQVLFEGTNISEGRGTTRPFEFFGAPFGDGEFDNLLNTINKHDFKGICLRPVCFEPTSNKWQNTSCRGFQLHITDLKSYKPYATSLALLQGCIAAIGDNFEWKQPPYEYEYEELPIDLIIGDKNIRQLLETMSPVDVIEKTWQDKLSEYKRLKTDFHLY